MSKAPSLSTTNAGRFPKGRSGNLKGRPKKSGASEGSAFEVLVDKTLTVATQGGTQEISVEEALQQRTYQDALAGKGMAIREVVKWIIKREAWRVKHKQKAHTSVTLLRSYDPGNANAALVLLKIAVSVPGCAHPPETPKLLIETWATQAALRRRRGGKRLSKKNCVDIRRCTRDPDTLHWPRGTST